ncbi:hypothetical protein K438DRAFT_1857907 [Mycena galopus ATCC 62051]|nr:hypothetical protein K438DRAFT_1857907 [Mycena galopus ATCC 62051]
MSQVRLSGPVGVCVLRCLLSLILSLSSPFPFSSILIFPRGRRRRFHCCRQRRTLPALTPPKSSRSFSLPPTLDPFRLTLPIKVGKRWARRIGRGRGLSKQTCGSGWTITTSTIVHALVSYAATGIAYANTILCTAAHTGP